jgi:hypothetical protein
MEGIYKKLLIIQNSIEGFVKNKQGHNYSYVDGNTVLNHIRPLMNDQNLLLKQEIVSIKNERYDYLTSRGNQKTEVLSSLEMRFTWIDADSGETDVNLFAANGMNDFDKGVGSAMTYGERYFLLKYFHIPTDADDVDGLKRDVAQTKTPLQLAIEEMGNCNSLECVKKCWTKHKSFQKETLFMQAKDNKKKSFETILN